jgi:hypothetical protein
VLNLLQELKSRPGDRPEFALRLWFVAFALLMVFAATVLNAALPLRLVDPRWLQGLIQALLSWGFLPLIALVLLQLAAVLTPRAAAYAAAAIASPGWPSWPPWALRC